MAFKCGCTHAAGSTPLTCNTHALKGAQVATIVDRLGLHLAQDLQSNPLIMHNTRWCCRL